MKVVIRLTAREEAKALPMLLRHSLGMVLKGRIHILSADAVRALAEVGIRFTELCREAETTGLERDVKML
jgi:hypothetical protein